MPSALSVSSAYSISRKLASTFGNGKAANVPKRRGLSAASLAPYSLQARASAAAAAASPNHTPGVVIDRIAVDTPAASMSASDFSDVHSRVGGKPSLRRVSSAM